MSPVVVKTGKRIGHWEWSLWRDGQRLTGGRAHTEKEAKSHAAEARKEYEGEKS